MIKNNFDLYSENIMKCELSKVLNLDFTCTLNKLTRICAECDMLILDITYINGNINANIQTFNLSDIDTFECWYGRIDE